MAESSIPVDLFNPGQVFACLGLAEAADRLLGEAEGIFDWRDDADVRFVLRAAGDDPPVAGVLRFIDRAQARAIAPRGSAFADGWKKKWGPEPLEIDRTLGYPFAEPDPGKPATLACRLSDSDDHIDLDHWGGGTRRDSVKFWAGSGGYPGAVLARDALALVRGRAESATHDPFSLAVPQSSSFRFDWRRDYIPLHTGFSPNEHDHIITRGYPLVELLAAIGLTNARPQRVSSTDPRQRKLAYRYAVVGRDGNDPSWLPLPLLRSALGVVRLPFAMRRFRMQLGWPGKENHARSITTVIEETLS